MKKTPRFIHFALLFGFSLTLENSAQAAIKTWTGTTDNTWATGANRGGAAPLTGDSLVFTSATGLGGLTLSDNLMTPASFNVAGITFNAGSGAYVINPATPGTNGFTLTGNVLNSSTSLQTINDRIASTALRTFTTTAGGGDIALGGNISGGGSMVKAGAGTLTLSGGGSIGRMDVDSGGLTVSSGTYTLSSFFTTNSVNNGTAATYTQSGGSMTTSASGNFIGNVAGAGTGTVNLSGGTFATSGITYLGDDAAGTWNLSGSGTFTTSATYSILGNNAVGTWSQTGGTANFTQINAAQTAAAAGSSVSVSGGTFNSSSIYYLGVGGASTLNVSGTGAVNLTTLNAGYQSAGTVNVNGGTLAISGTFSMGTLAGGSSTVNLDGGTLSTIGVTNGGNGTRTFNFNGGTLKATGASATFMQGLTTANVKNGGAIIDTNGFNITIGQSLVNFAGATTDSLTKQGNGTLTLSGTNTYTGATTITGGTLTLGAAGSINNSSGVSLGTVGTFNVAAKVGGYTVNNLSGSGNVVGALTVSTTLAIGNSPGTVNFDNNLTLGTASTFAYEIVGGTSAADLGDVAGNLTLTGSILDLAQYGAGIYAPGDKFTLFAYDGTLTGVFNDLTDTAPLLDGSQFTDAGGIWEIDYNDGSAGLNGGSGTNYVTITAVPEPAAALLGGIGLLALLRRRRN
jgi:autotransporter-associated beta strand protein